MRRLLLLFFIVGPSLVAFGNIIPLKGHAFPFTNSFDDGPCDDVLDAGQVGSDQTVCLDDPDPAPFVSISLPNNGIGDFEYQWIYTTTDPNAPAVVWFPIPGATQPTYDPPAVTQTTWFRRCTRPVGCQLFLSESNIVRVTVEVCNEPCDAFGITVVGVENSSCLGPDGWAEVAPTGGKAPFQYEWSHGLSGTGLATQLAPGTYSVTVTDAGGCTSSLSITIEEPEPISAFLEGHDPSCYDSEDGRIEAMVVGGTPPFQFEWSSSGLEGASVQNLSSGTYEVTVTDDRGCTATAFATLRAPQPLSVQPEIQSADCADGQGRIALHVQGGTPPYSYEWESGSQADTRENLNPGTYSVTVTDAMGCQAALQLSLEADCPPVMLSVSPQDISVSEKGVEFRVQANVPLSNGLVLLERSTNQLNYHAVALHEPAPTGELSFSLLDTDPALGSNSYRIRYLDAGGTSAFTSEVMTVKFWGDSPVGVYPNPAHDFVWVEFAEPPEEPAELLLTDGLGNLLQRIRIAEGSHRVRVELQGLSAGVFWLHANASNPARSWRKSIVRK